jgi:hypothetical protein
MEESWSNIEKNELNINKEVLSKISFINTLSFDSHASSSQDVLSFENIVILDFTKYNDIKLLEYQSFVANKLKQYCLDFNDTEFKMIKELNWLSETSNYLAKKYNQKILVHSRRRYENIPRNSYKFCNFGYTCKFSTNKQKCRGQHFVFNLVKADVDEVLCYINDNKDFNIKEISTSLNTISFVFNHMYDEMSKINIEKNKLLISHK